MTDRNTSAAQADWHSRYQIARAEIERKATKGQTNGAR